jgi:hypothetical protein
VVVMVEEEAAEHFLLGYMLLFRVTMGFTRES